MVCAITQGDHKNHLECMEQPFKVFYLRKLQVLWSGLIVKMHSAVET